MNIINNANESLRKTLSEASCVHPATVFDPMSGKIAESLNYKVGIVPGMVMSLNLLSVPDLMLLSITELSDAVRRIKRSCSMPIIIDADHGYGNALNVMRSVEELEHAGASGISIEDTNLPLPFKKTDVPDFISIEEATSKIDAAVNAKKNSSMMIIARTSSTKYLGIEEALKRGKAYQNVGADALFFPNIDNIDDVKTLGSSFAIPIILGGVSPDLLSLKQLSSYGINISLPGHIPYFAALEAYRNALKTLSDNNNYDKVKVLEKDYLEKLSSSKEYKASISKYLK